MRKIEQLQFRRFCLTKTGGREHFDKSGGMMNHLSCHQFTTVSPFLIPFSLTFIVIQFFYVDVLHSLAKSCKQYSLICSLFHGCLLFNLKIYCTHLFGWKICML